MKIPANVKFIGGALIVVGIVAGVSYFFFKPEILSLKDRIAGKFK